MGLFVFSVFADGREETASVLLELGLAVLANNLSVFACGHLVKTAVHARGPRVIRSRYIPPRGAAT